MLPYRHPERAESLLQALQQRILVIDGAMGTMLQAYQLDEAAFRGQRFANRHQANRMVTKMMRMGDKEQGQTCWFEKGLTLLTTMMNYAPATFCC